MEKKTYEKLIIKLDNEILKLQSFSPKVHNPAELPQSVGFILTEDTNVNDIPEDKVLLAHSMLHMFYSNKNGKCLTLKTIEKLHNEIKKKLKKHTQFDRLDKQ